MALTDIKVKTAKPKDKPYKLADGGGTRVWSHFLCGARGVVNLHVFV